MGREGRGKEESSSDGRREGGGKRIRVVLGMDGEPAFPSSAVAKVRKKEREREVDCEVGGK